MHFEPQQTSQVSSCWKQQRCSLRPGGSRRPMLCTLCRTQRLWPMDLRLQALASVAVWWRSWAQARLWHRLPLIHCHTNFHMPQIAKDHKRLRSRRSEVIGRSTPEMLSSPPIRVVRNRSFGLLACSGCPISKAGLVRKTLRQAVPDVSMQKGPRVLARPRRFPLQTLAFSCALPAGCLRSCSQSGLS